MKTLSMKQMQVHIPTIAWLLIAFNGLAGVAGVFTGGRVQKSHRAVETDFALENERHALNGLYRISAEQAEQDREIAIQMVNLLSPRFH